MIEIQADVLVTANVHIERREGIRGHPVFINSFVKRVFNIVFTIVNYVIRK